MNNNAGGGGWSSSLDFPPGYRFKPSDEEMMHHLFHKINTGVALMPEIKDVNLYEYEPETLARMYPPLGDDNDWYFFTRTKRKHPAGKKAERSAGNGFWRAMTADTQLKEGGQTYGRKLTLVYNTGNNKQGVRTCWMMHEYRVERRLHLHLADWVLCKVYRNARQVKLNREGKTQAAAQIFRVPPAAAGGGEGFNNGGAADHSRALINQTMLFNEADIGSSSSSGSMMMVGVPQEYINPQHCHPNGASPAIGGGRTEDFNSLNFVGCMMGAEDMGALFNPPNFYHPHLDTTSLFNSYLNHHAAAGGGSQDFNNGGCSSYVGECSSSNILNVEAQGFYNSNGSDDKNVEAAGGNEEFYINGKGHCV